MGATAPTDPMQWTSEYTPVLEALGEEYGEDGPLEGRTVAVATHMEAKSGIFVRTLRRAGATVLFTGSEPHSTDPAVVSALAEIDGIEAFVSGSMDEVEWEAAIDDLLEREPEFILDDGAELITRLHADHPDIAVKIRGGAEQTTTGIQRLEAMAEEGVLEFPVYAVNDTPMKNSFDNVHGTGESSLTNIVQTTNTMLTGKTVVVVGYGYCGRGLARKAAGLGARTIVTEIDPRKALEALMDGHEVMALEAAAPEGDYFITATGTRGAIGAEHFSAMKDGAILANAGHMDVEIDRSALESAAVAASTPRDGVTQYEMSDGRRLNLLAEGKLVNLTAPGSSGHPAAVMDTTFAMMFMAGIHLLGDESPESPGLYRIPDAVDREVASLKLDTMGISIDALTPEQNDFAGSWRPDRAGDHSSSGR